VISDHNHKTLCAAPGACVHVRRVFFSMKNERANHRRGVHEGDRQASASKLLCGNTSCLRNIRWRRHQEGRSIAMCTHMRKWQQSSIARRVVVVTVMQSMAGWRRCRRMHVFFFFYQITCYNRQSTVFRTNTSITDMNY
jgi:hypothetical protein